MISKKKKQYYRTYKINPDCLFQAIKNKKDLDLYCFHLNLHSLTKHKSIHFYKNKTKFLSKQTGYTQRKVKDLIKQSIEKGFLTIDFNPNHLKISSKLFTLKYFDKEITGDKMPHWAAKFITIETNEILDTYILKALALKIKQDQKGFIHAKKFLKEKNISDSKIQMASIKGYEKEYFHSVASFDKNVFLYLQDIRKLFDFADNSGASKLVKSLQERKLLQRHKQVQFLREQNGFHDRIDGRYMKKTFCQNGNFYIQQPNLLEFTFPFHVKEKIFVAFNNQCLKRVINQKKEKEVQKKTVIDNTLSKLKNGELEKKEVKVIPLKPKNQKVKKTERPKRILQIFWNEKGEDCGDFEYFLYKGKKYKKELRMKKAVDLNCEIDVYEWDEKGKGFRYFQTKPMKKSTVGSFDYIIQRKILTVSNETHKLILASLDLINPIIKKRIRKNKYNYSKIDMMPE